VFRGGDVLLICVVNRLLEQREKLDKDEEQAEEALLRLQSELASAIGRLTRIRKIHRRMKERIDDSMRRGLAGLEEDKAVTQDPNYLSPPELLNALDSHKR
jgi:SOS-response transcriptional repressor LexA